MTKDKKDGKKSTSKGVTANDKEKLLRDCDCFGQDPITVRSVRQDLENTIEMMGPSTPRFEHKAHIDTENEDSIYSTSVISSIVKIKTVKKNEQDHLLSYREDSQMTTNSISEIEKEIIHTNEVAIQTTEAYFQPALPYNTSQMMNYPIIMMAPQEQNTQTIEPRRSFFEKYFHIKARTSTEKKPLELYKIKIKKDQDRSYSPPKRLVFDLVDDLPKRETKTIGTNTTGKKLKKKKCCTEPNVYEQIHGEYIKAENADEKGRMDIYYFDHGNSEYYRTTDSYPVIVTELIAERTEFYTSKFWAQIFGTFSIGVSFITSFLLQLLRFILHGIIRPLIVGVIQLVSDYFIKPFLAIIFNGLIQPVLIFCYNVATSIRDFTRLIAESFGYFMKAIAEMCRTFRLVHINQRSCEQCLESPRRKCSNKQRECK